MTDNGLPNDGLSAGPKRDSVKGRRDFFKKAALVGVPAALATVKAPSAWAWGTTNDTASCRASIGTSGCAARNGLVTK